MCGKQVPARQSAAPADDLTAALLSPTDFRRFTLSPADEPPHPLQCEAYQITRPSGDYYYLMNWETTSRLVRLRVPSSPAKAVLAPLDEATYTEGNLADDGVLLHLPSQTRTLVLAANVARAMARRWTETDVRAAYDAALARETAELQSVQTELQAERAATEDLRVSMGGPTSPTGEYAADAATVHLLHFNGTLDTRPQAQADADQFTPGKFGTQALHALKGTRLIFALPEGYDASVGTLECWTRPDWPTADGQRHTLMELKGPGDWNQNRLMVYKNLDYEVAFAAYGKDRKSLAVKLPINVLRQGQWTHIAAVWNAATGLRMYVNGELRGEAAGQFRMGPIDKLSVGAACDADRPWDGAIEELRLSNVERGGEGRQGVSR